MAQAVSFRRVWSAVIAILAFAWLLLTVNMHGNDIQFVMANTLAPLPAPTSTPTAAAATSIPTEPALTFGSEAGAGLDLIDMYQCMCISANDEEFRRWVGWWLIAAVFGGIPVAILLRSRKSSNPVGPNL